MSRGAPRCRRSLIPPGLALCVLLLGPAKAGFSQPEPEELGWSDSAELSFVATGGNSQSTTFSFKNTLKRTWSEASLTVQAKALQAETTAASRFAQGAADDFAVVEESVRQKTAESYLLSGRFDRELSKRLFWFTRASWDRNEFAGIAQRSAVTGGFGHRWWAHDKSHFKTDYGLSVTQQDDVVDDPEREESFVGLRLSLDFVRTLSATTTLEHTFSIDDNLEELADLRADLLAAVAVRMTERLALKLSLELHFDNTPALLDVPLVSPAGNADGTVQVEAERLDSFINLALVLTF